MLDLNLQQLDQTAELGRGMIRRLRGAGVLIVDAHLRILMIDGDAHRGLDQCAVVGRKVADVIPAAAWEVLGPRYRAALDGHLQSFEYQAMGDGAVHSLRFTPIQHDTAIIGVMVLSQDVSARVAATARLRDSERLQRCVLEALDDGVIVLDHDARVMQANPAACSLLGVTLTEMRADPACEPLLALRTTTVATTLELATRVLTTGREIRDYDLQIRRDDGTAILLSANFSPLRDDEREISGLVLSLRDITERARGQQRAAESEERLREAHRVARLASWEWQPETGEVTSIHALTESDAISGAPATLDDLLAAIAPADSREELRAELMSIGCGDHGPFVRRFCCPRPTGPVWLETRARAIYGAGERLQCVRGTVQDVTEQELTRQSVAGARDLYQATLDSLSEHIAVLDARGEITLTNRAWDAFGVANGGAPAQSGANYLEVCDRATGDEAAAQVAAGLRAIISGQQEEFALEYPCHGLDVERWFHMRAMRFGGKGDARVVVAHEDVTLRRQAERAVMTQAALLDEIDVAVITTDAVGTVTQWNRGAQRLYGWTEHEARGADAAALLSPSLPAAAGAAVAGVGDEPRWEGELAQQRKDGTCFDAFVRARATIGPGDLPAGRIIVSVDTSERVASMRELQAAWDFMRALADSMGEGLFTLDLDGRVTYVNEAASTLLGWSSEELFGQVMEDVVHTHHSTDSERSHEECPIAHVRLDGETVRVEDEGFMCRDGSRLPVAYTAAPFQTGDGVEGCVVVFEDISERKAQQEALERDAEKLKWVRRIQDALTDDRFMLYAQPIVDLSTDEIVQRELLLRMRDPSGEIIPPGAYLPVAEQYGLIVEIDRWVIRRGAELAASGCPVEINVSACSIGDPAIVEHIESCLRDSGADPARLVFEITETALVTDEAAGLAFATRLSELGCGVALDDFGTGYGGFTYLKQLPVDYLKIDVEFVRDLSTSVASRHVVQSIVALASSFGLRTVAEGVEDAQALELLRDYGVDYAQGYHIGRPAPFDAAPAPPIGGRRVVASVLPAAAHE